MNGSRNRNDGQTMSVLFTMLLFLVFIMCALFTVLAGSKVYENISSRMDQTYTGSVALQYVANKVRQGDADKAVAVKTEDGQPVLEIRETIEGGDYITWIYYYEGSIRELFTYEDSGLGLADGLEILCMRRPYDNTGWPAASCDNAWDRRRKPDAVAAQWEDGDRTMNRRSGSGIFLMEMMVVVFFFMLCASTCILAFAKSDRMSPSCLGA